MTAEADRPVISVMLAVPDAAAAAQWYAQALGATELWNLGGVVGLTVAGAERAVTAGADGSVDQIRNHQAPWGVHRQGGFIDPFGHLWLVGDRSPLRTHELP